MKILLPSAKQMNENNSIDRKIQYCEKTLNIIKILLNNDNIEKMFKEKEIKRYNNILNYSAKLYEAIYLFDGLMYKNIKRENLNEEEIEYLKQKVYICTSLYGIINSYDLISPYRLDFLNKVGINLKKYWKNEYDNFIKNEELVISLLSSEFEEVFSKEIRDSFYKLIFAEIKENDIKIHSTISKKARGKFLTKLIENKVDNINDIKKIEFDDFKYDEKLSKNKVIYFIKNSNV